MEKSDYEKLKKVYYAQMACEESMCESEYERGKTEGMREMMCTVKNMCEGNKQQTSESGLHLQNVIARFFGISTESVDMLKLLIQYKRELETDEGEGLSDGEYNDYEGLKMWFKNGL